MTVVVWDGFDLAVDKAASDGFSMWEQRKLWKTKASEYITGTGNLNALNEMRHWYEDGCSHNFPLIQLDPERRCELIVVNVEYGLFRFEGTPHPIEHGFGKCAFGAGKDFAYGAMAMGATAEEAVIIANKFSMSCGIGVDLVNIKEREDEEA